MKRASEQRLRVALRSTVVAVLAALVSLPGIAAAQEFVVDSLADGVDVDPGSGLCLTRFDTCTLRAAVQEANALPGQQTIVLGPGVHQLSIQGSHEDAAATGDLDVTDELIIEGAGADASSVWAGNFDRAFDVAEDTNLTLVDLTVERGSEVLLGGGLRAREGALVFVSRARFERNSAIDEGGGVALIGSGTRSATLLAFKSEFRLNRAGLPLGPSGRGGAIHASGLSSVQLLDTTLRENVAGTAAAIWVDFGVVTIDRSTIVDHPASEGTIVVSTSSAPVRIENSTISRNQADIAIVWSLQDGPVTFESDTIVENEAPFAILGTFFPTIRVGNSVIFNSVTNQECSGVGSLGYNATPLGPEGTCAGGATDLQIADPRLGELGDNGGHTETHLPLADSPLRDAGDNARCFGLDQRTEPRPRDSNDDGIAQCDIGAVEAPEPGPLAGAAAAILGLAILAGRATTARD